ncbi:MULTISPECIES: TPM domain-containing protein [Amniculibacterium]|uniref:TPM domain-containing protein n=1 Tax=Amniculibacterium TaxID=2715289 RepID=UPI000F5B2939|nr:MULTISPECIES: TPM domain-containing protein [Amniculibacterium]
MNTIFTDQQLATLVEAVRIAENKSTGEIRVHIDQTTDNQSTNATDNATVAFNVFKSLCMGKTKEKNAVLFHINFHQHYLTIIGDTGIHEKVTQHFWDQLHDKTTSEFAKGNYLEGLRQAILETGIELKKHFPILGENPNELSDEITFS